MGGGHRTGAMTHSLKTGINLYDELTIYSDRGDILYQGQPEGYPVERAEVFEREQVIVLLKYWTKEYGAFQNLLSLKADGKALWHAELPSSGDAYVDFEVSDGKLFANSWSCCRVEIDTQTGKILDRQFTK